MGADIENPAADGCVAVEERRWNTFKEKLFDALFLRNPNAGGGGGTVADVEAAKPVQPHCGWRNYVLYVCSAIFFIVACLFLFPQIHDDTYGINERQHILMASIGFPVAIILSVTLLFAGLWRSSSEPASETS
jgi:hypothetical protein